MFHCFNISKHISISVLFFINSVPWFAGGFGWIFRKIAAKWVFSTIYLLQGLGFLHFFVPEGWGIHPLKNPEGGGWWLGLELTDTEKEGLARKGCKHTIIQVVTIHEVCSKSCKDHSVNFSPVRKYLHPLGNCSCSSSPDIKTLLK